MVRKNLILAAVLTAFVSCTALEVAPEGFRISVSLPGARTSIEGQGGSYKLYWADGDRISINGTVSNSLSGVGTKAQSVEFTFSGILPSAQVYNFLYPGTTETDRVTFPSSQLWKNGSFDSSAAPMYGSCTSLSVPTLSMSNLSGVFKFSFTGTSTISSARIIAVGNENLSGTFSIGKTAGALNGVLTPVSGTKEVSVDFGAGLPLSGTARDIYVCVPVQTYDAGFEARFYDPDGKWMTLKFFGTGKVIEGASVYELPQKTFEAGRAEVVEAVTALVGVSSTLDETSETGDMNSVSAGSTVL